MVTRRFTIAQTFLDVHRSDDGVCCGSGGGPRARRLGGGHRVELRVDDGVGEPMRRMAHPTSRPLILVTKP